MIINLPIRIWKKDLAADFFSFQTIAPAIPIHTPGPSIHLQQMLFQNNTDLGGSGPYVKIDSASGTDEKVRTCLLLIISVVVM